MAGEAETNRFTCMPKGNNHNHIIITSEKYYKSIESRGKSIIET